LLYGRAHLKKAHQAWRHGGRQKEGEQNAWEEGAKEKQHLADERGHGAGSAVATSFVARKTA